MQRSLTWKIALGFSVVALITAGLVAVMIRLSTTGQLTQLIVDQGRSQVAQALVDYYQQNGSWQNIQADWTRVQAQTLAQDPDGGNPGPGGDMGGRGGHGERSLFGLADAAGRVLVSADPKSPVGVKLTADQLNAGEALVVDGTQVGTLLVASQLEYFNPEEARFLERTNKALLLAVFGALVVALMIGVTLSRSLTHPLKELTTAAENISRGQLEQQVKVSSRDEIGQLAAAFNSMSQEVARGNQLRRRMTADIAHDLRTPLTVIAGYIESMRDGVLPPTPQRLALIYTEIERLQNLVGDLRTLSQADAGELPLNLQRIRPAALLERAAGLFQHHARQIGVELTVNVESGLPEILIDEARMMQVLDNLIGNALRFTPAGGRVELIARCVPGPAQEVELLIRDTGSGISPEDLPQIFDRFYRADPSRHSEGGESGLGLAIVKAFVEAQNGRVWADSLLGHGTIFHILFPS